MLGGYRRQRRRRGVPYRGCAEEHPWSIDGCEEGLDRTIICPVGLFIYVVHPPGNWNLVARGAMATIELKYDHAHCESTWYIRLEPVLGQ